MFKYLLAIAFYFGVWFVTTASSVKAQTNLPQQADNSVNVNNIDFPANHLPTAGDASKQFFTEDLIDRTTSLDNDVSEDIFKKAPLKIDSSLEKMDKFESDRLEDLSDKQSEHLKLPAE